MLPTFTPRTILKLPQSSIPPSTDPGLAGLRRTLWVPTSLRTPF